jgi:hypothetical protein
MPRIAFVAVLLVVILAAGAGAWLAFAYSAMPVSATGFAYGIGARVFLTSDDVHALWEGRTPQIVARRRQHSSSNKYVWQRGTLARPGNCLDPVQASEKPPRSTTLCTEQDAVTKGEDTLYVQVTPDNAISIRTGTHSPGEGWRGLLGGLYEAEGKIGIGESFDGAATFSLLLDADELNIADLSLPPDPNFPSDDDDESCTKPAAHALRTPAPLWLLPAVPAALPHPRYQGEQDAVACAFHPHRRADISLVATSVVPRFAA